KTRPIKEEFDKKAFVTDSLTGLHNLRYLDKVLSWEVVRADRWQLPLTMLMLDIDCFKRVNDCTGISPETQSSSRWRLSSVPRSGRKILCLSQVAMSFASSYPVLISMAVCLFANGY